VGRTVARAIGRTGIDAPNRGAHLLRHSVATAMLRDGMSLPAIGALLRHRSVETTMVYAKVDVNLLKEVVQPWPGVRPC
jgi:site-specific recombinase XerD